MTYLKHLIERNRIIAISPCSLNNLKLWAALHTRHQIIGLRNAPQKLAEISRNLRPGPPFSHRLTITARAYCLQNAADAKTWATRFDTDPTELEKPPRQKPEPPKPTRPQ
jgi:hypothetical protein